jgi:hypothetical protein
MKTIEFEWYNDGYKRLIATKFHSVDCWMSALSRCGWETELH